MKSLEARVRDIGKAVAKLEKEQGRIARRNARNALFSSLRGMRRQAEREFPAHKKESLGRKKNSSAAKRTAAFYRKVHKLDYVRWFGSMPTLINFLRARIPTINRGVDVWVPRWATVVGVSELRKVKKSRRLQKARIAEHALASTAGGPADAPF